VQPEPPPPAVYKLQAWLEVLGLGHCARKCELAGMEEEEVPIR
jgi:hypothetical protein